MRLEKRKTGGCLPCVCGLAVSLLLLLGCSTREDSLLLYGVRYEVDEVVLRGVTRFKKKELLKYLYVGETSWVPLTETYYFSDAMVPVDTGRIIALYRAYGYDDIKVKAFRILRWKRRKVDVLISVDEGEPRRIRTLFFDWDAVPEGAAALESAEKERLERTISLRTGDPVEIPTLEADIDKLVLALKERGYPHATADAALSVHSRGTAVDVRVQVRAGPWARIGDIRVEGLHRYSSSAVQRETAFAVGEPFSPTLLSELEQRLYAMDIFTAVEVSAEETVANGTVPLRVVVSEAKPQSIKVGLVLGFESSRWEQGVTARYSHRDLFFRLVRFDNTFHVGYAELPAPYRMDAHGPILKFEPRFMKKGWPEQGMVLTFAPSLELGIEEGYQFYTPRTHVGVSRLFGGRLLLELGHIFNFFDFFNVSKTLNVNRTLLGLDYRDPYFLSYLTFDAALYLTDRRMEPRNGVVLTAAYQLAGPFGGQFHFHKITPGLKAYWQIVDRVQLAFRAETGFILPFGDAAAVPFNMKYYLGGADTVRGWGQKRLAPKTVFCPDGDAKSCRQIPIGGNTEVLSSVELRVRTIDQLYVAAFVDMGDVQPGQAAYRPEEWAYTSGGGLRYASPMGKLRLDVAARLNSPPLAKGESRWAFHIGLGEAF